MNHSDFPVIQSSLLLWCTYRNFYFCINRCSKQLRFSRFPGKLVFALDCRLTLNVTVFHLTLVHMLTDSLTLPNWKSLLVNTDSQFRHKVINRDNEREMQARLCLFPIHTRIRCDKNTVCFTYGTHTNMVDVVYSFHCIQNVHNSQKIAKRSTHMENLLMQKILVFWLLCCSFCMLKEAVFPSKTLNDLDRVHYNWMLVGDTLRCVHWMQLPVHLV